MAATDIIQVLPDPLKQPNHLAILASVSFHGLFFAVLALQPQQSSPRDSQIVDLITLSPEEQKQLPALTPPLLPTFPTDSSTAALPFAFPSTDLFLPPPPLEGFDLGSLPPSLLVPSLPLPPPVDLPPPPQFSFRSPPGSNVPLPPIPPPNLSAVPPSPTPSERLPGLTPTPTTPTPTIPTPESTPAGAAPLSDPVAIAPGEDERQATSGLISWLTQVRETADPNNLALNPRASTDVVYPQAACKDKLTGKVAVAVLVNPDGQLVPAVGKETPTSRLGANPQLLLTSQQEILDQAAIAAVKELKFEPTGKYQALMYAFEYKYSEAACAANPSPAAPVSSPAPTSASPTASPAPAASPSPVAPAQKPKPPASSAPTPNPNQEQPSSSPALPPPSNSTDPPQATPSPAPSATESPAPETQPSQS